MAENFKENKPRFGKEQIERQLVLKDGSKICIRKWLPGDIPEMYKLILEYKELDPSSKRYFCLTEKDFASHLEENSHNVSALVTEVANRENASDSTRIVGMCLFANTFVLISGLSIFIELVFVKIEMRGIGITKTMLDSLILYYSKSPKINALQLTVSKDEPKNVAYFERQGFLRIKEKTLLYIDEDFLLTAKSTNTIKSSSSIRLWKESDCSVVQQLMVQSAKEQGLTEFRISKETLLDAGFGSTPPTCYCFLVETELDNGGELTTVGYGLFCYSYDVALGMLVYVDDIFVVEQLRSLEVILEIYWWIYRFSENKQYCMGIMLNSWYYKLVQDIEDPSALYWLYYQLTLKK